MIRTTKENLQKHGIDADYVRKQGVKIFPLMSERKLLYAAALTHAKNLGVDISTEDARKPKNIMDIAVRHHYLQGQADLRDAGRSYTLMLGSKGWNDINFHFHDATRKLTAAKVHFSAALEYNDYIAVDAAKIGEFLEHIARAMKNLSQDYNTTLKREKLEYVPGPAFV